MSADIGEITMAVRVLISEMPSLQADVIARLVDAQSDMTIVGRGTTVAELPAAIHETRPHVVVVSACYDDRQNSMLVTLGHFPDVSVLLVAADTDGMIAVTTSHPAPDDQWHETLIKVIRESAGH